MPKDSTKKKGGYKKNEIKGGFTLPAGTEGFLLTYHRNKERGASSEILDLFNQHADRLIPEEEIDQTQGVEDELQKELGLLKSKEKRLFGIISTGIECTMFVRVVIFN